jgi:integrase/recombinase XerD
VQRVLMPGTEFESWTVLGDDHTPVEPIERFLSYLMSIEKSPNTVKAYAHDLKDWLTYLDRMVSTGGRRGWRTWPGSSPGCGCLRRHGTAG